MNIATNIRENFLNPCVKGNATENASSKCPAVVNVHLLKLYLDKLVLRDTHVHDLIFYIVFPSFYLLDFWNILEFLDILE